MNMYIYIYIIYAYIYIYLYIHMYMICFLILHICIFTQIIYNNIPYNHTYMCIYIYICMYVWLYFIHYMYIYIHTYLSVCECVYSSCLWVEMIAIDDPPGHCAPMVVGGPSCSCHLQQKMWFCGGCWCDLRKIWRFNRIFHHIFQFFQLEIEFKHIFKHIFHLK